jgi:methyltransferase family protein
MISPEELPSQNFQPLRYGLGAWTENLFFAYDLVAQLSPKWLVELGTDRGESYFAFCQSVAENQTETRCFAVDHWRGDAHAGSYDEATFLDVERHNREHYAAFSTLVRASFDAAVGQFAAETIDLLHVDGHHSEEAVRHDLELWLPKLRPGGILLMHDVAMRGRGFGVWKVWEELVAQGRSFTFDTPPGLGIWEKPRAGSQPPLLEMLFSSPNELRSYYREQNARLQQMMAQQWRDGSIRQAPLASETIIQVFWSSDGSFSEEQSVDARIGHGSWKEVAIPLPNEAPVSHLRIDFFSALTIVEIASIQLDAHLVEFPSISLGGDCVRLSLDPFRIQITGIDPQIYPPAFRPALADEKLTLRMRLRVQV